MFRKTILICPPPLLEFQKENGYTEVCISELSLGKLVKARPARTFTLPYLNKKTIRRNCSFTVLSDLTNVKRPYWWLNLAAESEKKDVI